MFCKAQKRSFLFKGICILGGCGLLLSFNALGCGADGSPGDATGGMAGGAPVAEPKGASLFIEVRDQATDTPLPGAMVRLAGKEVLTDEWGQVLLEELPEGRLVAQVRAPGFAPATAVAEIGKETHAGVLVRLLLLSEPIPFDSGADAVIRQSDVQVAIPAGSLVNANGEPVKGMVEATVVLLDPTTDAITAAPGPLVGTSESGGEAVDLESVSMVEISLWQNGELIQLAPGATSMLEVPVPGSLASKYPVGTQIPSWSYNLELGVWERGEMGTIEASKYDSSQLIWVVPVHHFTWWNSDHQWNEKHCYDVLVLDTNGKPLGNQPVTGVGTSYVGISWTKYTSTSGASIGHACVDVQKSSTARIYLGATQDPQSPPKSPFVDVSASSEISACSGQGAACEKITISLTPPGPCPSPGTSQACPGGASQCWRMQDGHSEMRCGLPVATLRRASLSDRRNMRHERQ